MKQNMEALRLANEMRLAQRAFTRYVHTQKDYRMAQKIVAGSILNPSPAVAAMRPRQLLDAMPRVYTRAVEGMLAQAGLQFSDRRIRDLTDRERRVLADVVLESRQSKVAA